MKENKLLLHQYFEKDDKLLCFHFDFLLICVGFINHASGSKQTPKIAQGFLRKAYGHIWSFAILQPLLTSKKAAVAWIKNVNWRILEMIIKCLGAQQFSLAALYSLTEWVSLQEAILLQIIASYRNSQSICSRSPLFANSVLTNSPTG